MGSCFAGKGAEIFFFSFFIGWMAEMRCYCPSVCSGGQALGAVFNQLVRSRAQLLVEEELFVPSEQAKKNR